MKKKVLGDVTIVSIPESVDTNNAEVTLKELQTVIEGNISKLVCDFSSNNYVSSAGLRTFLEVFNLLEEKGGKLAMYGMSETVFDVFDVTGFADMFPVVHSEKEAVEKVREEGAGPKRCLFRGGNME